MTAAAHRAKSVFLIRFLHFWYFIHGLFTIPRLDEDQSDGAAILRYIKIINAARETVWLTTKMQRIAQTILAMMIALSVATLPAAAGFAAISASTADMSVSSAMPDCDHHNHAAPAGKPQKTADDFACMAACALHCFNFTTTGFSDVAFSLPASAALRPVRMDRAVSSLVGSPPFRPPRI